MESTPSSSSSSRKQCTSCGGSEVSGWCVECVEALCDQCISAHRRVKMTRSHTIQKQPSAGSVSITATGFCQIHTSEPLKLFCFQCNQLTCRDCQLMAHRNHRFQFVQEAFESQKKRLESLVQSFRAQKDTVRQSLLDMEARLQDITDHKAKLRVRLRDNFHYLVLLFKNKVASLCKAIEKSYQLEVDSIEKRKAVLRRLEEKQQLLTESTEYAKNINSVPTLMTHRSHMETQLKELLSQEASPLRSMIQLDLLIDNTVYDAILSFGELTVSMAAFSRSRPQTSSPPAPVIVSCTSIAPQTSTHPAPPSYMPLPQTGSASDICPPDPVGHLPSPLQPSSNQPHPPPSCCLNLSQSNAPVATPVSTSVNMQASVQSNYGQSSVAPTGLCSSSVVLKHSSSPAPVGRNQSRTSETSEAPTYHASYTCPSSAVPLHQPPPYPGNYPQTAGDGGTQRSKDQNDDDSLANVSANHSRVSDDRSAHHQQQPAAQSNYQLLNINHMQSSNVIVNHGCPGLVCLSTSPLTYAMTSASLPQTTSLVPAQQTQPKPSRATSVQDQDQPSPASTTAHNQLTPASSGNRPDGVQSHDQSNVPLVHQHSSSLLNQEQTHADSPPLTRSSVLKTKHPILSYYLTPASSGNQPDGVQSHDQSNIPLIHQHSSSLLNQEQAHADSPPLTRSGVLTTQHPILTYYLRKPQPSWSKAPDDSQNQTSISPHHPASDTEQPSASGHSSCPQHQHPTPTVKAVADSACDCSVAHVSDTSNQQEAGENEPTSTVSESDISGQGGCAGSALSVWDDINASITFDSDSDLKTSEGNTAASSPGFSLGEPVEPDGAGTLPLCQTEPEAESVAMHHEAELMTHDDLASLIDHYLSKSAETQRTKQGETARHEENAVREPARHEENAVRVACSPMAGVESDWPSSSSGKHPASYSAHGISSRDVDSEDLGSARTRLHRCKTYKSSQRQPRVSLFRLPISTPRPGQPSPRFLLLPGDAEDEIHLQEIDEGNQSDVPMDFLEPLSSPESPPFLQTVFCSVCRSASSSIVCTVCGRGYHRNCHIPTIEPSLGPEWRCLLCQDLSDPRDPYSSQRRRTTCLSLLDQRKCERLLLYLMCEESSDVWRPDETSRGSSHLKLIAKRLSHHRSLPYRTPAEFVSDVWLLFETSCTEEQSGTLTRLQESFHNKLVESFGTELHPSLLRLRSTRHTEVGGAATLGCGDILPSDNNQAETGAEDPEGSKIVMDAKTNQTKMSEAAEAPNCSLVVEGTASPDEEGPHCGLVVEERASPDEEGPHCGLVVEGTASPDEEGPHCGLVVEGTASPDEEGPHCGLVVEGTASPDEEGPHCGLVVEERASPDEEGPHCGLVVEGTASPDEEGPHCGLVVEGTASPDEEGPHCGLVVEGTASPDEEGPHCGLVVEGTASPDEEGPHCGLVVEGTASPDEEGPHCGLVVEGTASPDEEGPHCGLVVEGTASPDEEGPHCGLVVEGTASPDEEGPHCSLVVEGRGSGAAEGPHCGLVVEGTASPDGEAKLKETRKRLGEFLDMNRWPSAKRPAKDKMVSRRK